MFFAWIASKEKAKIIFKRLNLFQKVEGRTRAQMEKQLEDWMELADSEEVPPFLLLLSRSFETTPDEILAAKVSLCFCLRFDLIFLLVLYRRLLSASPRALDWMQCWSDCQMMHR